MNGIHIHSHTTVRIEREERTVEMCMCPRYVVPPTLPLRQAQDIRINLPVRIEREYL